MKTGYRLIQTFVARIISYGQNILITSFVLKVTNAEVFGEYALILMYLGVFFGISSLGVGVSSRANLARSLAGINQRKYFYPPLIFQLLSTCCISLALYFITCLHPLFNNRFLNLLAFVAPIYLLTQTLYSNSTDYFRYTHRITVFNLATVFQPVLYVSIVYIAHKLLENIDSLTLIVSLSLSGFLVGLVLLLLIHKNIGIGSGDFKIQRIKHDILIGYPVVIVYLIDAFITTGDRFIIAYMMSVEDLGMYIPAFVLGSLMMFLPKVFNIVLLPVLTKHHYNGNPLKETELLSKTFNLYLLLSVPYFFGCVVIGKDFLSIYATQIIANSGWKIVPMVALGTIFYGMNEIMSLALSARLQNKQIMNINIYSAIFGLITTLVLLVITRSIFYASVSYFFSQLLAFVFFKTYLTSISLKLSISKVQLFYTFIYSSGMSLLVSILNESNNSVYGIIISIIVGIFAYVLFVFCTPKLRDLLYFT